VCIGRPISGDSAPSDSPGSSAYWILRAETRTAMQQLGAPSLKDLTPAMVRGSEFLSSRTTRSCRCADETHRPRKHVLDMQPFGCLLSWSWMSLQSAGRCFEAVAAGPASRQERTDPERSLRRPRHDAAAVTKHLAILEAANLVTTFRHGARSCTISTRCRSIRSASGGSRNSSAASSPRSANETAVGETR